FGDEALIHGKTAFVGTESQRGAARGPGREGHGDIRSRLSTEAECPVEIRLEGVGTGLKLGLAFFDQIETLGMSHVGGPEEKCGQGKERGDETDFHRNGKK